MRHLLLLIFIASAPAQTYTQGWNDIGTKLTDLCPAIGASGSVAFNSSSYDYPFVCHQIVDAWSGATAVTKANSERLVIWGGGHTDYGGNEIYVVNMRTKVFTRLNNPSQITAANVTCAPTNDDGTPRIRHTTQLGVYLPTQDVVHFVNGGVYCGNGDHYGDSWDLNPYTGAWTARDPVDCSGGCSSGPGNKVDPASAGFIAGSSNDGNGVLDSLSDSALYVIDAGGTAYLMQYYPDTNTYYERRYAGGGWIGNLSGGGMTIVLDSLRHKLLAIGARPSSSQYLAYQWDTSDSGNATRALVSISAPTNVSGSIDSTCNGFYHTPGPGITYNATLDKFVAYPVNGGNTIYKMDPVAFTCTTTTFSGGPANGTNPNGMYGRFAWFPDLSAGVYAVVNSADHNAFALALTAITPSASSTVLNGSVSIQGKTTIH